MWGVWLVSCLTTVVKCQKSKMLKFHQFLNISQPAIACSKLTIETLEQGVKYVQS